MTSELIMLLYWLWSQSSVNYELWTHHGAIAANQFSEMNAVIVQFNVLPKFYTHLT